MLPLDSKLLEITLSPASNIYRQGDLFCLKSGSGDAATNHREYEGELLYFLDKMYGEDEDYQYESGNWNTTGLAKYYSKPPLGVLMFRVSSGENSYISRNLISLADFHLDMNHAYYRFKLEIDDPVSQTISRIPANKAHHIESGSLMLGEGNIRKSLTQEYGIREIPKPPYKPTKTPNYLFINVHDGSQITKRSDNQYSIVSSVYDQTTNSTDFRGPLDTLIDSYSYVKPSEWTNSNFNKIFRNPPYLSLFLENREQYNFKLSRVEIDGKVIRYIGTLVSSNNPSGSINHFGSGSSQPLKGALIFLSVDSIRNTRGGLEKSNIFLNQVENYD
jgi:hypothetical protein